MNSPSGYRSLTRRLGVVAALAGVLAAGACGGAADAGTAASDDGGGGSGSGLTVTVTFEVTGAATLDGTAAAYPGSDNGPGATTCAAYARGGEDDGETHFVLPTLVDGQVGGHKVFLGALVDPYAGPGTYAKKDLHDQGSPPGLDVDGTLYLMLTASTSQVTVGADGGGAWDFTGLVVRDPDGTDGEDPIAGRVSWTCAD